jgi:hypothetical protein
MPRVPSRFEPVRNPDGVLAGRSLPSEEGLENNSENERQGDVEVEAATDLGEQRSRSSHRVEASLQSLQPSTVSSEYGSEPMTASPAARTALGASAPIMSSTSGQAVLQATSFAGRGAGGSSASARHTIADAGTPVIERAGHASGLEPIETRTVPPIEPATPPSREAIEGASQNRSAEQTPPAQTMRPSSENAIDSSRIISPAIRPPAFPEQRDERRARSASMASSKSAIRPPIPSSHANDTRVEGEVPTVPSPQRGSMTVDSARSFASFQEISRSESGPGDAPAPKRNLNLHPVPRGETGTFEIGSEHAAAARAEAPNRLPAPQPHAGDPSEPAIRVTIGRVEVRAVFPEQPVKRSPPPRFRPSVTLDDYLNRGRGAKR